MTLGINDPTDFQGTPPMPTFVAGERMSADKLNTMQTAERNRREKFAHPRMIDAVPVIEEAAAGEVEYIIIDSINSVSDPAGGFQAIIPAGYRYLIQRLETSTLVVKWQFQSWPFSLDFLGTRLILCNPAFSVPDWVSVVSSFVVSLPLDRTGDLTNNQTKNIIQIRRFPLDLMGTLDESFTPFVPWIATPIKDFR